MSYVSDSNLKQIKELKKNFDTLANSMLFSPSFGDTTLIYPNLGKRDAAHGGGTGIESSLGVEHILEDVGTGLDTIKLQATNVIVNSATTSALTLKNIVGNIKDGVKIVLQSPAGKTLELLTGGVFAIAANVLLSDTEMAIAQFDKTMGKFKVVTSSGSASSGANTSLSNLAITSINQDLIPQANKDLGTSASYWRQGFISVLDIPAVGTTNASRYQIYRDASAMDFNVPTGSSFIFRFQGSAQWTMTSTTITGTNLILSTSFVINNAAANPSFNGEFRRNGNDVKVFSGGAVRNLSDIVAGGGANVTLSNLTSPTDVNQSLLPQAGLSVGGSSNYWSSMFSHRYRLGTSGSVAATENMLFGDASGTQFNTPNTKSFFWSFNGTVVWSMSSTVVTGPNLIITSAITINDSVTNPSFNGQLQRNGSDLKVFSGGVLKNFTQMPQLNSTNIWTSGNNFNSFIAMKATQFLLLNSDDTADTSIRQSTAIGVTPKKLDLSCFADLVFQGIGETTSARSRGMFKGLSKTGAPTTTEIPASFCTVVKNTSDGSVKLYYNDAGTLKSVTLS